MPKTPKRPVQAAAQRDMPWDQAIQTVLAKEGGAMHYERIAAQIINDGLRVNVGATPPSTVAVVLGNSLREKDSPYLKVSRGIYALKAATKDNSEHVSEEAEHSEEISQTGAGRALGMFWRRDEVSWKRTPKLLGRYGVGASDVNFASQRGVYLLHDRDRVVYVGKAMDTMFARLKSHTADRLAGRWDRFSWFGLRAVNDQGGLADGSVPWSQDVVVATMEALLIESLEPPLNRRRGDGLNAFEYLQVPHPDVEDARFRAQLDRMRPSRRSDG